ncbi:Gag-like protein [Operophtera brumata]|uniref:Gag-like protein n=1 Tax=Operophtera brumata TaxID=104452 RepID=A0A0L7L3C6_OPEBR|nr:Gag-like protein [Operophtera brumata]
MTQEDLVRLYRTTELLSMPGVMIEHWKGAADRAAQCHRCQAFGHSSANCHRPQRCVRCGGQHFAADCPRPLTDKPTCTNCGKDHTANSRLCPAFRREARKRGLTVPHPLPPPNATRGRASSPPPRPDGRQSAPHRPAATAPSRPIGPRAGRTAAPAPYSQPVAQPAVQEVRALANDPTERGASLPSRGRRNRGGGKKRRKPVASPNPLPLTAAPVRPARTPMVETCLELTPAYQQPAQAPPQPQMQPQRQMQPQPRPQPYQVPTYPESPSALFRDTPAPTVSLLQTAVYQPLPQRVSQGRPPRARPSHPHEHHPDEGANPAPPSEANTAGVAGNPIEIVLGVLTEFLLAIAAGGDLQGAALRGLALLHRHHNG